MSVYVANPTLLMHSSTSSSFLKAAAQIQADIKRHSELVNDQNDRIGLICEISVDNLSKKELRLVGQAYINRFASFITTINLCIQHAVHLSTKQPLINGVGCCITRNIITCNEIADKFRTSDARLELIRMGIDIIKACSDTNAKLVKCKLSIQRAERSLPRQVRRSRRIIDNV